jgi:hypothetical protein
MAEGWGRGMDLAGRDRLAVRCVRVTLPGELAAVPPTRTTWAPRARGVPLCSVPRARPATGESAPAGHGGVGGDEHGDPLYRGTARLIYELPAGAGESPAGGGGMPTEGSAPPAGPSSAWRARNRSRAARASQA